VCSLHSALANLTIDHAISHTPVTPAYGPPGSGFDGHTGPRAAVTALASGDVTGDGNVEIVVCRE
jgi:hypothetical protein